MPPIKLRIDAPCTESWEAMSLQTEGRHCASCQKIVQDFTQYSDAELVAWFEQSSGRTCGRLRTDQMNVLLYDNVPSRPTGLRGWVRWALALFLGWQSARAQVLKTGSARPVVLQPLQPVVGRTEMKQANHEVLFYFRGQAVYPDGKPAQRIIIEKIDRGTFCRSDTAGQFAVPIYESDQHRDSLTIWLDYTQKVTVSTKQEQTPMLVTLPVRLPPVQNIIGGGITVIRQPDPPKRAGGLFRRSNKH